MSSSIALVAFKGTKDEDGQWTYDTKVGVCALIQQTQNVRKTSEITGVPYDTIRDWIKTEWWPQVKQDVDKQRRAELRTRLSGIVGLALEKIEDRLTHGDFILNNKTGEIQRKPVSLKDANSVAKEILGQQINLERLETESTHNPISTQEALKLLAKEFAKFSASLKRNEAIDVEFVEIEDNEVRD